MTVSGIAELTLRVRDLASLERFYVDVFGLRVLKREDDRTEVRMTFRLDPALETA